MNADQHPPPHTPEDPEVDGETIFAFVLREQWPWLALAIAILVLMYALGPILTPFVIGGTLAYVGNPLVDRLQARGLGRTATVALLFIVVGAILVAAMLLIVPALQDQIVTFAQKIPEWLTWIQQKGLPKIGVRLPFQLNVNGITKEITEHLGDASDTLTAILGTLSHSTPTVIETSIEVVMVPLVAFYLLRDWHVLIQWVAQLIPRPLMAAAVEFAQETDQVLSGLIRGQLAVMFALALAYSLGLWMIGLDVGLLIGIVSGLLSFIPYLGFISGFVSASIAIVLQTHQAVSLLWVTLVFAVGQVLEQGILVPMLIGDRIGLHPVAVIFAVMAGGQLFGFMGILVALPVAAILSVMLRHARKRWLTSPLYRGRGRKSVGK